MKVSKEIIERYHQGRCSLEEQQLVERWLDSEEVEMSFPENADIEAIGDKGWKKISSRYHLDDQINPVIKRNNYRMLWQLAACMTLVTSAVFFYYLNTKSPPQNPIVYQEIKTRKGEKLSVTLPDGTVVSLNSESILRFPQNFKGGLRELRFTGEAYFNVAKHASKPFVIYTEKTKIQVLGTKFNLRALTTETATSVVVEEGKVKFSGDSGKQQLILTANRRGVFESSAKTPFMNAEEVYAGKYFAWKDNGLLLDNLSIGQASQILERWYNVKIKISRKELYQERYTGSFNNPSLKEVLESMSFALKFRYRQQGQTFILY